MQRRTRAFPGPFPGAGIPQTLQPPWISLQMLLLRMLSYPQNPWGLLLPKPRGSGRVPSMALPSPKILYSLPEGREVLPERDREQERDPSVENPPGKLSPEPTSSTRSLAYDLTGTSMRLGP